MEGPEHPREKVRQSQLLDLPVCPPGYGARDFLSPATTTKRTTIEAGTAHLTDSIIMATSSCKAFERLRRRQILLFTPRTY